MDKISIRTKLFTGCLTLLCTTVLTAQTFNIGKVNDFENQTNESSLEGPRKTQTLKKNSSIKTDQVYSTNENSWTNIKIFDANWVRINPSTKLLFQYNPKEKHLEIKLFSGSLKVIVSKNLNPQGLQKISVNVDKTTFSSSDGKFSVSRNELFEITNLYVEKGTVLGFQNNQNIIAHTLETTSISDETQIFTRVRKMDEKEAEFIIKNKYLKK